MIFLLPMVIEQLQEIQSCTRRCILASTEAVLRLTQPNFRSVDSIDTNGTCHTQRNLAQLLKRPFLDEKQIFRVLLPHTVETCFLGFPVAVRKFFELKVLYGLQITYKIQGWCKNGGRNL